MNQKTLLPSLNSEALHTTLLMLKNNDKSLASSLTAEAIVSKHNFDKSIFAQTISAVKCEIVTFVTFKWVQIGHGHVMAKEQLASKGCWEF